MKSIEIPSRSLREDDRCRHVSQQVSLHPNRGAFFTASKVWVTFHSCTQDLMFYFGTPQQVLQKTNMLVHSSLSQSIPPDYFWCFFDMGVDFLMDGSTHIVKKIICHSNILGEQSFNQYEKCHFIIEKSSLRQNGNVYVNDSIETCDQCVINKVDEVDSNSRTLLSSSTATTTTTSTLATSPVSSVELTVDTPFALIHNALNMNIPIRPSSTTSTSTSTTTTNASQKHPFQATSVYAFDGILFEVTKSDYIVTVTLFSKSCISI
jgi:hypothetical protein